MVGLQQAKLGGNETAISDTSRYSNEEYVSTKIINSPLLTEIGLTHHRGKRGAIKVLKAAHLPQVHPPTLPEFRIIAVRIPAITIMKTSTRASPSHPYHLIIFGRYRHL
jgi:hypothetical protein